jgi:hypothetical protein
MNTASTRNEAKPWPVKHFAHCKSVCDALIFSLANPLIFL